MSATYPPAAAEPRDISYESASTSISDLTRTGADPTLANEKSKQHGSAGLFSEPGSLPVPDAGHHHLGVVFEGLTVHGTGGAQRTVEGLEISVMKVRSFWPFRRLRANALFQGVRLLWFCKEIDG